MLRNMLVFCAKEIVFGVVGVQPEEHGFAAIGKGEIYRRYVSSGGMPPAAVVTFKVTVLFVGLVGTVAEATVRYEEPGHVGALTRSMQ